MERKIRRLAKRFPDKIRGVLRLHAELILTISKRDWVPVDIGNLEGSGFVDDPQRGRGAIISIDIVYGGPSEPYAVVQHEDLELKHPNKGQAKYLERPLMAKVPTLAREMARDLNIETMV